MCVWETENPQSHGNIHPGRCRLSGGGGRVDTRPRNPGNQQSLRVQMKHVVEASNYPVRALPWIIKWRQHKVHAHTSAHGHMTGRVTHTQTHTDTHTHTHTWVPNLTPVSTSLLLFLPIFPTSILIFKKTACGSPLRLPLPPSLHSKNTLPPSSLTHSLFHPSNFPHPSIPLFLSSLSSSVWALARAQRVFWEGVWHTTASRTRIGRRARVHTHTHTNTHTHSCDCEADRGRQKNRKKKHAEQLSLSLSHTHTHTHTHRGRQVMQRDSASAAEESLWHIDPPLSAFTFSISLLCIFFLSFTFSFLFSSRCTDIKKKKKTANGGVSWQTHTLLVLRKVC